VGKIQRFLELSASEKALFTALVVTLPLVRAGLRLLGMRRLQAMLKGGGPEGGVPAEAAAGLEEAERLNYLLQAAAANGLLHPTCLERSLVLVWLLRKKGLQGDLHIGVRPGEGGVEAHAWVEYAGTVLNDSDRVRENYAAFHNPI
jgi:hypothetical protein